MSPNASKSQQVPLRHNGVLFDLDTVAVPGRKILYDLLNNLLQERDAALTPALFARYCLRASPRVFAPRLLQAIGKPRLSSERLLTELQEQYQMALGDGAVVLDRGLADVLTHAQAEGMQIGALTAFSPEVCASLMERLGLRERGVLSFPYDAAEPASPSPGAWISLVRLLRVAPSRSVAIVSDQGAGRAALLAGLKCVVRPDAYTGFQDFGGSDLIVDRLDSSILDKVSLLTHA